MKIQIIALGMTDQSHRKFYNTQDMGLGRALADMGHCVTCTVLSKVIQMRP